MLVQAAKDTAFQDEDSEANPWQSSGSKVGDLAAEVAYQEEILKKERELEEARKKLLNMRKIKYAKN